MSIEDLTRLLHQPAKHYVGSRLQMARPTLDSDFNEDAVADEHDHYQSTLAVVGALVRVDGGFMPDLRVGETRTAKLVRFGAFFQAFVLDFDLQPGAMYIGGRRYEQPRLESVLFQREYLQIGPATAPRAQVGSYRQLAILRGWEQPVSAVEDAELLEPALGGADGALRTRTMRRVEVHSVQADDCGDAFDEVLAKLSDGVGVEYDARTGELRSTARLQMTFNQPPAQNDCPPCTPSLHGRYLGSESQAIRVMLATPTSYVWAFDDGAPLYRARLVVDGSGGAHVEMLTPPRDTFHHPRIDTVVEFLPWSALLENGHAQGGKLSGENVHAEKIAARTGFFAEVDAPYDPAQRSLHVRLAPGAGLELGLLPNKDPALAKSKALQNVKNNTTPVAEVIALRWDAQHPLADQLNPSPSESDGFEGYVYMRVWHRKSPGSPLTIPTASTEPLGQTGLVPVFTNSGRVGDYWIVSVRPQAPEELLPREVMLPGGVPPHGPREVVAPISLLRWQSAAGVLHTLVDIHDCRPRLPPLTDRRCDTFLVGPTGDFTSIQAAIDALPLHGGRIRVLAGTYHEELRLSGRSDVTILGCGSSSRIETPGEPQAQALITLEAGEGQGNLVLRDLTLVARGQTGVSAYGERLVFDRLSVRSEARGNFGAHSALQILDGRDVRIVRNTVTMDGSFSDHAAIYIESSALGVVVEDNDIVVETSRQGAASWGGIHLGAGSREVEIRGNRISGGRGHGVTLGSVVFRATDGRELRHQGAGRGQSQPDVPFAVLGRIAPVDVVEQGPDGAAITTVFHPDPAGALEHVVVEDNDIRGMGGSGVSSLVVEVEHPPELMGPPLCLQQLTFVTVALTIRNNRIVDNARLPPGELRIPHALGGVVLSEAIDLTIVGNAIRDNGPNASPTCGIHVAYGRGLVIAANRLDGNGNPKTPPEPESVHCRGGIVLKSPPARGTKPGIEDVLVRDNVVMQRSGPALSLLVAGKCSALYNHLEGIADPPSETPGALVRIIAVGHPWEAVDLEAGSPAPERWIQPQGSHPFLADRSKRLPFTGAGVVFSHNHVSTLRNPRKRKAEAGIGVAVALLSTDSVTMVGNQLAAQIPAPDAAAEAPASDSVNPPEAKPAAQKPTQHLDVHALAVAATVNAAHNRVAENADASVVSLVTASPLLTSCTGNVLTHCHVAYGGDNHGASAYFTDEGNLVLLRLLKDGCAGQTKALQSWLEKIFAAFFGGARFSPVPLKLDGRPL